MSGQIHKEKTWMSGQIHKEKNMNEWTNSQGKKHEWVDKFTREKTWMSGRIHKEKSMKSLLFGETFGPW